jgi:hypothetical protein
VADASRVSRCGLWLAVASIVLGAVEASSEPRVASNRDPFIAWTRSLAPDARVRVVIEDGMHALEAEFLQTRSASRVLDAFAETFDAHDLDYDATHPTDENPFGRFVGSIDEQEKRLLVVPSGRAGETLVRSTSFQRSRALAREYPSWLETHPEIRRLGDGVSLARETYGDEGRTGLFKFDSQRSVTAALRSARSRLVSSGWFESAPESTTKIDGSRVVIASLVKDGVEMKLTAQKRGRTTSLVALLMSAH